MEKNIKQKLKKWSKIVNVDLVDMFTKLSEKARIHHPEFTDKQLNAFVMRLITTKFFRGKLPTRQKPVMINAVILGDTGKIDRLARHKRYARWLFDHDRDLAIAKQLCFEDGRVRDPREFLFGGRVKNPNYLKDCTNVFAWWRRLFMVADYLGEKQSCVLDGWSKEVHRMDVPFFTPLTFAALVKSEGPVLKLGMSKTTKFLEAPTPWPEDIETLIIRYHDIVEFDDLLSYHEENEDDNYRYVWTRGVLKWMGLEPDPETGIIRHRLIPLDSDIRDEEQDYVLLNIPKHVMGDFGEGSLVYVLGKTDFWKKQEQLVLEVYGMYAYQKVGIVEYKDYDEIMLVE